MGDPALELAVTVVGFLAVASVVRSAKMAAAAVEVSCILIAVVSRT